MTDNGIPPVTAIIISLGIGAMFTSTFGANQELGDKILLFLLSSLGTWLGIRFSRKNKN